MSFQNYIQEVKNKIASDGIDIKDFQVGGLERGCFGPVHELSDDDWYIPYGLTKQQDTRCEFCFKRGIVDNCEGPIKCNEEIFHPGYGKTIKCGVCCDSAKETGLFTTYLDNVKVSVIHPKAPYYLIPEMREEATHGVGHYMLPTQASYLIKISTLMECTCYINNEKVSPDKISMKFSLDDVGRNFGPFRFVALAEEDQEYHGEEITKIEIKYQQSGEEKTIKIFLHCFQNNDERMRDNIAIQMEDFLVSKIKLLEYTKLMEETEQKIQEELKKLEELKLDSQDKINRWFEYKYNQEYPDSESEKELDMVVYL